MRPMIRQPDASAVRNVVLIRGTQFKRLAPVWSSQTGARQVDGVRLGTPPPEVSPQGPEAQRCRGESVPPGLLRQAHRSSLAQSELKRHSGSAESQGRGWRRLEEALPRYRSVITSPLRSAATINPTWRPEIVSTAPFWLVSTIMPPPEIGRASCRGRV